MSLGQWFLTLFHACNPSDSDLTPQVYDERGAFYLYHSRHSQPSTVGSGTQGMSKPLDKIYCLRKQVKNNSIYSLN